MNLDAIISKSVVDNFQNETTCFFKFSLITSSKFYSMSANYNDRYRFGLSAVPIFLVPPELLVSKVNALEVIFCCPVVFVWPDMRIRSERDDEDAQPRYRQLQYVCTVHLLGVVPILLYYNLFQFSI